MSAACWIVVDTPAGRRRGPGQALWPRANWHETDVRNAGPAGPGATLVLEAAPCGPFHVARA